MCLCNQLRFKTLLCHLLRIQVYKGIGNLVPNSESVIKRNSKRTVMKEMSEHSNKYKNMQNVKPHSNKYKTVKKKCRRRKLVAPVPSEKKLVWSRGWEALLMSQSSMIKVSLQICSFWHTLTPMFSSKRTLLNCQHTMLQDTSNHVKACVHKQTPTLVLRMSLRGKESCMLSKHVKRRHRELSAQLMAAGSVN